MVQRNYQKDTEMKAFSDWYGHLGHIADDRLVKIFG